MAIMTALVLVRKKKVKFTNMDQSSKEVSISRSSRRDKGYCLLMRIKKRSIFRHIFFIWQSLVNLIGSRLCSIVPFIETILYDLVARYLNSLFKEEYFNFDHLVFIACQKVVWQTFRDHFNEENYDQGNNSRLCKNKGSDRSMEE